MKQNLLAAALCTALLSGCFAHAQSTAPHKTGSQAGPHAAGAHSAAAKGRPSLLKPETLNATAPAEFKVRFTTTCGDFVVQVHRDWAPMGADRFYNLVRAGFYNNAAFFRVLPRFIAQFGLSANPGVSKAWQEAKIKDEPVKHSNTRGTVVFAMAGPNSRTTQAFINTGDNARLDKMGFAPFGEVTEGMDAVDRIFPGYGERADQEQIVAKGDAYLTRTFPEMDKIKTAKLDTGAPAPAGKTPAKTAGATHKSAAH